MKHVKSGDKIIASLERGEELCGTLKTLAAKEDIKFALVRAHGSCVRVTLGSYDKKSGGLSVWSYNDAWDYELASVTGAEPPRRDWQRPEVRRVRFQLL